MTSPPEALVELRHLTFGYGERVVLDDISFSVPRGKVTTLMGASGGGKTTILRLIGGQNRAQSGQMLFDGQDVTPMNQSQLYAARRRRGRWGPAACGGGIPGAAARAVDVRRTVFRAGPDIAGDCGSPGPSA